MAPTIRTARENIAWSYANLARAHAALKDGATSYRRVDHIIRNRLYRGLASGTLSMRSLLDDERLKMTFPQSCCYCGADQKLTIDHLIPRVRGGQDWAENLVWACRSCNSSKHGKDMLDWMRSRNAFPSILLLRRYLKIAHLLCESMDLIDESMDSHRLSSLPFEIGSLPHEFPPLSTLVLWIQSSDRTPEPSL